MKVELIYCDYCKKLTKEAGKEIRAVHGFYIQSVYSKGGWGSATNFLPEQRVEICTECFNAVESKMKEVAKLIEIMNIKKPTK